MELLIQQLKYSCNIKLEYYKNNHVQKRIEARINHLNLQSEQEYLHYLINNPLEHQNFLDQFTINYSYFFRNTEVFNLLRDSIISSEIDFINVWSCPCASGEEPYTIAMIFDQASRKDPDFPYYKIRASDINNNALQIANSGMYGEYSLHETPELYIKTYFTTIKQNQNSKYLLNQRIKNQVEFINEDLIEGHGTNQKYHVIFCRNFLMYIEDYYREHFLKIIDDHLIKGGILIIGKTETLRNYNENFRLIDPINNFYCKGPKLYRAFNIGREIWKDPPKRKHKKIQSKRNIQLSNAKNSQIPNNVQKDKSIIRDIENSTWEDPEQTATELKVKDHEREQNQFPKNNAMKRIEKKPLVPLEEKKKSLENKEIELWKRERRIILSEMQLEQEKKEYRKRYRKLKRRELMVHNLIKEIENIIISTNTIKDFKELKEEKIRNLTNFVRDTAATEPLKKSSIKLNQEIPNDVLKKERILLKKGESKFIDLRENQNQNKILYIDSIGSGILLILKIKSHHFFSISWINSSKSSQKEEKDKKKQKLNAEGAIKKAYERLKRENIDSEEITAYSIGGAKIISDKNFDFQKFVDEVKKQLDKFNIPIIKEDLGGISERSIILDFKTNSIFLKKSWQSTFLKV